MNAARQIPKTALVTGAAGFIGSAVALKLQAQGWHVVGIGRGGLDSLRGGFYPTELPDPALGEALQDVMPALCVHCAGPASVQESVRHPALDFAGTVPVVFHLLDSIRLFSKSTRLIYLSSAAVYGNPGALPISESAPRQPISPYGFHRLQCEDLIEEYRTLYGLDATSVRIFSAYGSGLRRQVVWDLCLRALGTDNLRLQGTGAESRDFVHVDDVALAVSMLAETVAWESIYNVGTGKEVGILELARAIVALLPRPISVEVDGCSAAGMPMRWRADIGRLSALGFKPSHQLLDDLPELLQCARRDLASSA